MSLSTELYYQWNYDALFELFIESHVCQDIEQIQRAVNVLRLDGRFSNEIALLSDQLNNLATEHDKAKPSTTSDLHNFSHPNASAIAKNGARWLNENHSDALLIDILRKRVELDPLINGLPKTLLIRLYLNNISVEKFKNYAPPSIENPNAPPLLLEAEIAISTMLSLELPQAKQLHLSRLFREGRCRYIQSEVQQNLCIFANNKSYIQVTVNSEGLVDLFDLAHECGHALDFELRNRWQDSKLRQEFEAIQFENKCFQALRNNHFSKETLNDLRKQRLHDYTCWNWQLVRFEQALYTQSLSAKSLDDTWKKHTGNTDHCWRNIPHYFIAPFYLSCYPFAC